MKCNKIIRPFLMLFLLSGFIQAEQVPTNDNQEIEKLYSSISQALDSENEALVYKQTFASYSSDENLLILEDGLGFKVNWWYRSVPHDWKKGDQVYVTLDIEYGECKIEHVALKTVVWAELKRDPYLFPKIKAVLRLPGHEDTCSKIILNNEYAFRSIEDHAFSGWSVGERVIIFANSDDLYQLFNLDATKIVKARIVENIDRVDREPVQIKDIFNLENRLAARVLQQPEAINSVFNALLNYSAGLKEKEKPIGVFLFLGSTGVGKTELAKALNDDIYGHSGNMLRFDMSHFTAHHTISRLIGSPPGYQGHVEGGQLSGPLLENPRRVVLLDEMEKAHPQVLKAFLPVFDEGFILDAQNNQASCSETIFIMTSNLCGDIIVHLSNLGCSSEEILETIEPYLMEALSPELYNRVEPVLFRPIAKETMEALVELMLGRIKERLLKEKNIQIEMDDSLKVFLAEKGYHPLLGARPLKKLIEKRVLTVLAHAIIKKEAGKGTILTLLYDEESDSVIIHDNF